VRFASPANGRTPPAFPATTSTVEQLLVGWVRLDPRNRKVDLPHREIRSGAPTPVDLRQRSRVGFVERWRRFAEASLLLFGFEPPREWFEDDDLESNPDMYAAGYSDDHPPNPPFQAQKLTSFLSTLFRVANFQRLEIFGKSSRYQRVAESMMATCHSNL